MGGHLNTKKEDVVAQNVFFQFPSQTLLNDALEGSLFNANQLCDCMDSRKQVNSSFQNLAEYLIENSILREAMLNYLRDNDNVNYNQLLTDLGINQSNFALEITEINSYISLNGSANLMTSLNTNINYSNCSGLALDFVMGISNSINPLLLEELSKIPEFNELMFKSGLGTVGFNCSQTPMFEWFNMLSYRNPAILMNLLVDKAPGARVEDRKEWIVNWFRNNDLGNFLNVISLMNPSAISGSQTTNSPLYASTTGALDMQQYFELIKQNYGNSFYDQIFAHFASSSTLYVDSMKINEWHIYGSSRLGVYESNKVISWRQAQDQNNDAKITEGEYTSGNANTSDFLFANLSGWRGFIKYELTNHLGNVLTVISDKKLPVCSNGTFNSFMADVVSATDYSPFGAPLPGRTWQASEYRFGFNGQEKDDEVSGEGNEYDYGARIYNSRLGRWLTTDAKEKKYPGVTPYAYALNSSIIFKDPDGNDVIVAFTGGPDGGGKRVSLMDAKTTGQVVAHAYEAATAKGVKLDGAVFAPGVTSGSAVDNALAFISDNYTSGEKLIIYGYSYGGDFAVELAEKLKEKGIQVDLLITVDASDGPLGNSTVNNIIPENVKANLNIYQTDDSGASSGTQKSSDEPSSDGTSNGTSDSPGSNGGPNVAADPSKSKVVNGNLTSKNVTHGNIAGKALRTIDKVISANLSNPKK